jgi:hypothetical protein
VTDRQRESDRINTDPGSGQQSSSKQGDSAASAWSRGIEARPSRDSVRAATVALLRLLDRAEASLSGDERAAADALARAALFRDRVRAAEQAQLAMCDTGERSDSEIGTATDRKITGILAGFLREGIEPRLLKGLLRARRDTQVLDELLRYRNRAERIWRHALWQWGSASGQDISPDHAIYAEETWAEQLRDHEILRNS